MADRTSRLLEHGGSALHSRIAEVAARRNAESERPELQLDPVRRDQLGIVTRGLHAAQMLNRRTVLLAIKRRSQTHVTQRGGGDLLFDAWLIRLPSETPERGTFADGIPHIVRSTVESQHPLPLGGSQYRLLRHSLEQPQPKHGLRNAHRSHEPCRERAKREFFDTQLRFSQRNAFPVGELGDSFLPIEVELSLRWYRRSVIREVRKRPA